MHLKEWFHQKIAYVVGNGKRIKFWEDRWLGDINFDKINSWSYMMYQEERSRQLLICMHRETRVEVGTLS